VANPSAANLLITFPPIPPDAPVTIATLVALITAALLRFTQEPASPAVKS
jgi:hypothetical protein